ncbi:MFS transporter [Nocardia sp. NEAU-G5]|uniref:MFS transporter n=1 Tax=Nocardia albiluteola TaxID=2842303 RepID=A0ABS6BA36_9NOCA|nr:MFS transporter [Nocardia albiluteola]MBU3067162.1 MFS transporter [Nocardia albiluteola]
MVATVQTPFVQLWLAVLGGYLALGATLQELPGYVSDRFGASPFVVGVVVGSAFAGTALTRPFAGRAGDAGRARAVAIAGAVAASCAALGHLWAPNLAWLIAARVLMGVGEAALFSGVLPWVLSDVRPSRSGRVAGWFGLSMWGGLSVGPLVAVGAGELGGATAVWALVVLLPSISAILLASARRGPQHPARIAIGGWRDLVPAGVGRPGLMLGMAAYGYGTLTALLVLFLDSPGIGGAGLGLVLFSSAFLVTRALGSPLVDRFGGHVVARAVLIIEAAGLLALASATTRSIALVAVVITGVGLGLIYPASSRIVLRAVAARTAGAAMGVMTSFWDVGILVAGPMGGLAAARSGFPTAFWSAAMVVVGAVVFTLRLRPRMSVRDRSRRCGLGRASGVSGRLGGADR